MDQLKPCPFCGGEVSIALTEHNGFGLWLITRGRKENACSCRVFMESRRFIIELDGSFDGSKEREELIERWNRREPVNNILQRLEEIAEEHPYKVAGDFDTYSEYNQAWEDCISRVIYEIEKGGTE